MSIAHRSIRLIQAVLMFSSWLLLSGCAEPPALTLVDNADTSAAHADGLTESIAALTPRCLRKSGQQHIERRGVRTQSSALALARWAGRDVILLADEDEDAVHVIDSAQMQLISTLELPGTPAHLLVTADGRVAVTLRYKNRVAMLEPAASAAQGLSLLCVEVVAREPIALAEHGDDLLVLSGYGAKLVRVRRDSLALVASMPLAREPRGLLLSQDGRFAWVSHMVGGVLSKIDLRDNKVERIVTHRSVVAETESRAIQGFGLAAYVDPHGRERILLPQVSSNKPDPEQLERDRYYGSTARTFQPWVASVDSHKGKMLGIGSHFSFSWRHLCMLPRAALVQGERLWVACLDKGSVIEMDARFIDPMTAVYRQYHVASGPSAMAMSDDGNLFVWSLYGHELSRLAIPALDEQPVAESPAPSGVKLMVPRRKETQWSAQRQRGREIFVARDDDRVSKTGATCESCHPDGRDDGLMWAQGTSTLFLAGRLHNTAPFGWHGQQADLETRVQSTFLRLRGSGMKKADRDDLDGLLDYLRHRRPPPPPLPQSADARASIERGEQIFTDDLSCTACHPGGSANGSRLRVGETLFDTPSLAYVAHSAPYFHDNRYATLEDLLGDPKEPMDKTAGLSEQQRADLASYLRSLPHGAVQSPPEMTGSWRVVSPSASASQWHAAKPAEPMTDTIEHPGRYLAKRPQQIEIERMPEFALPYDEAKAHGALWLAMRTSDGQIMRADELAYVSAAPIDEQGKSVVPRFVISAQRGPTLEIQQCRPLGAAQWGDYPVHCPDEPTRVEVAQLGHYGMGARTRMEGKSVLLISAPDASPYDLGDVTDLGTEGRGSSDLHAMRLEPGSYAELVRLWEGDDDWGYAGLPDDLDMAAVNLEWPEGATKPRLLVARMTRKRPAGAPKRKRN